MYINFLILQFICVFFYYVYYILFFHSFEANFGSQTVTFTFKCLGLPEVQPGQIRVFRKGNKMEVLV